MFPAGVRICFGYSINSGIAAHLCRRAAAFIRDHGVRVELIPPVLPRLQGPCRTFRKRSGMQHNGRIAQAERDAHKELVSESTEVWANRMPLGSCVFAVFYH